MGERIAGKYELIQRIGRGGMADVHLAKQVGLQGFEKEVVIKLIRAHLAGDTGFVEMFLDEAKTAARLKHRNIVDIYEAGATPEGLHFIAMEYLQGMNISELIVGHRGALPPAHALHIAHDAAAGLAYAHSAKAADGSPLHLVHRDISTVNLYVTLDGVAKLLDFGIAKAAHRTSDTTAGIVKGNYGYMSPEQAAGETVDQRSDLFSLGVVLWEMLAGRRLFKGENNLKLLRQIHQQEIAPPSSVNPEVTAEMDALVLGLLERDRDRRTQSAAELLSQIERLQESAGLMQPVSRLARFVGDILNQKTAAPSLTAASTKASPLVAKRAPDPAASDALAVAETRKSPLSHEHEHEHADEVLTPSELGTEDRIAVRNPWGRIFAAASVLLLVGGLGFVFVGLDDPGPAAPPELPPAPAPSPDPPPEEPKPEPEVATVAPPEPKPVRRRRRRVKPKPAPVEVVPAPAAEKQTGRIYVPTNTNPFYEVYVDGEHIGKTPFFKSAAVEVKSGVRRIEFRSPEDGAVQATKLVTVAPGAVVRVKGPAR